METGEEKKQMVGIYRTQSDGYIVAAPIGQGPMMQIWEPELGCFVEGWYEWPPVLCEVLEEQLIDEAMQHTEMLRSLLAEILFCYELYAEGVKLAARYRDGENRNDPLWAEGILEELRERWEAARQTLRKVMEQEK